MQMEPSAVEKKKSLILQLKYSHFSVYSVLLKENLFCFKLMLQSLKLQEGTNFWKHLSFIMSSHLITS